MDVSIFSAFHISADAFEDGAHQSPPLHFHNHLPEQYLFQKQKQKTRNKVQNGDFFFHSTIKYNMLVKPDVSVIVFFYFF